MRLGKNKAPDYILIFTVITLLGIGMIIVFSSSAVTAYSQYGDSYFFLKRQLLWGLLGLIMMFTVMNIDYQRLKSLALAGLVFTIISLVLVLIPGIGVVAGGSRRWLGLGPIGFQPSVLAKLVFVVFVAKYLSERRNQINNFFHSIFVPLLLLALIFGLILAEPDLGTGVALAGAILIMIFAAGANLLHLSILGIISIPLFAYMVMSKTYRLERFLSFLNPWEDPLGSGYNIIQSLYALGSGGLFGLGLGRSRQKFFYLPEQYTDFVYAVLGEELGFLGSFSVLFLFFIFAWRGYRLALRAPDLFGCLLAVGITTVVMMQAVINIGVVTGSIPITGITLPFISYGGSSLVIMLTGVGILLNISKECS